MKSRSPRPRHRYIGWRPSIADSSSVSRQRTRAPARCGRSRSVELTHSRRTFSRRASSVSPTTAALAVVASRSYANGGCSRSVSAPRRSLLHYAATGGRSLSETRVTADGLLAWLSGQPNVPAAVKRAAGVKGEIDHFGALAAIQATPRRAPRGWTRRDAARPRRGRDAPAGAQRRAREEAERDATAHRRDRCRPTFRGCTS